MAARPVLLGLALWAAATSLRAQVLTPVAIAFTAGDAGDAVLPLGSVDDAALEPFVGTDFVYYEQGELEDKGATGLPDNGEIVSPATGTTFQLQPYDGVSALNFDGTISLQTPASYSNIGFLVNSLSRPGRAAAPIAFVLNFSDGSQTTLTTAGSVPFWSDDPTASGGTIAYSGVGVFDAAAQEFDPTPFNFDEYDFALSAADTAKTLDSIDIESNGAALVTYAVSGIDPALPTPEPGTAGLLLAGLGCAVFVWRGRRIVAVLGSES